MAGVVELELPARPEYLAIARLVVCASAQADASFDEDRIADLRLAVSEACTNAMEATWHAAGVSAPFADDDPTVAEMAPIFVRCSAGDGRVEVDVSDHGSGFDPSLLVVHPPVTDPARLDHERGLGIPLIRILADEVRFWPSAEGTVVRMVLEAG